MFPIFIFGHFDISFTKSGYKTTHRYIFSDSKSLEDFVYRFFSGQVNSELRKQNIQIRFLLFHSMINKTRCNEKSEGQTVEMSKFSLVNGTGVKMSNSFRDGNRI